MALLATSSCGPEQTTEQAATPPATLPELQRNNLAGLPGAIYLSQAESTILWQPWTPGTLRAAKDAGRMLFTVVALPQQPDFQRVIKAIEADSAMVAAINRHYVPVLVDGDAAREVGLLTADLCAEIRRPLRMPLLLWLTPDANPVAWIPVANTDPAEVRALFNQSHATVSFKWDSDPEYILNNSEMDNGGRRERISRRQNSRVASTDPGGDSLRAVRQLAGLYDPVTRNLDEAGGLFPSGALDLLATALMLRDLPADLRGRVAATLDELLDDLLPSAMFDPLDGGLFSVRGGLTWSLPTFVRDTSTQGRATVALINAHLATGNPLALERALGVIRFIEKSYRLNDDLYSAGMSPPTSTQNWLWTVEDVEALLSADDAAAWIEVTGMKGLGNIPFEVDTRREYFRQNSISDAGSATPVRGDEIRKTLLGARRERLGPQAPDVTPHAGATFRMVSAFAAAYVATGDGSYRDKAVTTLARAREVFSFGPQLRMFAGDAPPSLTAGRAFLYALALQAVLDVADITHDESWVLWADDLAATASELFTSEDFLKECPDEASLIHLPITDVAMLFDDSTAGLVSMAESRMAARGRPLPPGFSRLATPLPAFAQRSPMRFTDIITPTLLREHGPVVAIGPEASAGMREAVSRLPLRTVRRSSAPTAGSGVLVTLADGSQIPAESPAALREVLLHPAPPR
jgi:uncharacterized protein YyaL (SSP411 family)